MTPAETDVLLQYGVTKPTINALAAAGLDSLEAILRTPQEQLPLIQGVAVEDARAVVRLVGLLADAGVSIAQ
jgi:hypothetical protein